MSPARLSREPSPSPWTPEAIDVPRTSDISSVVTSHHRPRHIVRCCRCPQLERLFVQLPSSSHDIFEDNFLEVAEEDVDEPDEDMRTMIQMKRKMNQYQSYLRDVR
ncbi:unnamed protein product [Urochloa humidicola]